MGKHVHYKCSLGHTLKFYRQTLVVLAGACIHTLKKTCHNIYLCYVHVSKGVAWPPCSVADAIMTSIHPINLPTCVQGWPYWPNLWISQGLAIIYDYKRQPDILRAVK